MAEMAGNPCFRKEGEAAAVDKRGDANTMVDT